ncbi:probable iron-sulfur protein (2Fe-2S) [Natronomonas pharaonis DSM 2160]|uniref:Probable iron-sulfur protein (2Fe-2S) n=1 Tax=Natronomonas pharaonis (strain ATCC 35678 / DSM 2160 / CIP 103997 / JCM 8858 / NBRC 14720 / NCIMB 2260 / Gabara) TaxID=348780 RepID=A0A1U7ETX9_NATPD|nr:Rieske 2Fe-2S domain-containing protein [Natronomonas pharaonis]CAI48391.2 probable iron-sulfur protein (2Fe-2S) [Natronomonas pharaonis DSM 2160]
MDDASHIVAVDEVPTDSTLLVTLREGFDEKEVVLVRQDDDVVAWRNYCPHWTDVRLDKGSGAEFRDEELVCTRHGAIFEADSGECSHGPCEGAYLEAVDVAVEGGEVYLTDDDYEFDHIGPKSDRDLSSGRIGFGGN